MEADESLTVRSDIACKVSSGELLLYDKTTYRGRIWRIFSRVTNREGVELDFVCCKNCHKIYKFNNQHTSNLCRHSCYIEKFTNAEHEMSFVEEAKPIFQISQISDNNLNQLLTKWLIENCHSCDLIQSEGLMAVFQELLKLGATFGGDLDVGKLLPSVSEVSENITVMYKLICESIKMEIAAVNDDGFGLTADIWTDSSTNESYIALTIHYLKDGLLTYRLLGLQTLEGIYITNLNIAESIERILEEFDCPLSKKCFFVTDGASNLMNTFQYTKTLPCISQLLSNAIVKSVEKVPQVTDVVNFCSKLVNFLNKKAPNNLSCQLAHKNHHNRSLIMYKMLNSILIYWDEIKQIVENMNENKIAMLNKNKLMAILYVLRPFEEAIETLEDDSHATLHLVVVYMHELTKFCQKPIDEYKRLPFVKSLQENLRLHLDEIVMENITILHKVAVFLYPPTNKLLPFSDIERQTIEDECISLLKIYENESKFSIKQEIDDQPSASFCKRRKLLADFLESEQNYDSIDFLRHEIQNYKNSRVAFTSNFNVFNWWELQKYNFPLLYKLSCTVLATPATIASSRRVLFNAKSLITEKYKQYSTEQNIEKIMFLSTNAPGVELDKYLRLDTFLPAIFNSFDTLIQFLGAKQSKRKQTKI